MDKKILTKLLATMLVFTLTFANIALLGIYAQETFAASVELEEQDKSVDKANIEFDAYFQEEGVETHTKDIDLGTNSDNLYLSIKVSEGYLTNGKVKLENSNFSLVESEETLDLVQDIDTETNTITLNQIDKGESAVLEIPIKMNTGSDFNVSDFNKISDIILEGTYVNNNGDDISISKTIEVNAKMTAEAEANLESEISKYVQFDINGEKGVVLQQLVKSNIVGNVLPAKQTVIEIEIPKINGVDPTTVVLSSTSTKASNGENGKTFIQGEDYTYQDGKIVLTINNEAKEDGTISWMKDVQDEIILTCVYGEKAIVSTANVGIKVNSNITLYNEENSIVTGTVDEALTLNEKIGDIMTYGISTNVENLQKGYMLVSGADNTEYVDTWTANIGSRDLVDSIVLENETSYLDANQNEYPSEPIYTYTKIASENFLGILGEDGYINIYGEDDNLITTLNKDNLEYTYTDEVNYIRIETSKPISEGMLKIENGREIKPLEYSKEQEKLFTGIKTEISGKVILGTSSVLSGNESKEMKLEEPTTQAELTLGKSNISTVVTNEGVELRVTLKTTEANTILYKNPVIEIVFPKYVTDIKAENVRLLYEQELAFESATMYTNENGNKVIRIALTGEQTKFNKEAQTQGATLVMKADITVDELTPTRTENIQMNVSNETTGEVINTYTPMNFVAPVGMVTVNQITNYNNNGETATSISGKAEVGEIEAKAEARQATVNMTVINNYRYNAKNVVILGRTPFEGNKTIEEQKDLGSTFTAKIATTIQATTGVSQDQMTVYYSQNGEANRDLSDSQNGWTTDANSLTEIKSFMIVLNEFSLNTGDTISFSYNVEIPEGLEHDEYAYGTFAVYYNREEIQDGISVQSETTEVTEAPTVGITTGTGPNLEVNLTANVENNAEVEEHTEIEYTAKVTNKANRKTNNITLTLELPNNVFYVSDEGDYKTETTNIDVGEIEANSSKEVKFTLMTSVYVDTENQEDNTISIKTIAKEEGYNDEFTSNELVNTIAKPDTSNNKIKLEASTTSSDEAPIGANRAYSVEVAKNTEEEVTNIVVKCVLPEGLTFSSATENGTYDENTRTVTWNFDTLDSRKYITLYCTNAELPDGVYELNTDITFTATYEGSTEEVKSNTLTTKVYKDEFTISQTSNIPEGNISAGDEITYTITVKNSSSRDTEARITDYLPTDLSFIEYSYTQNGETVTKNTNGGSVVNIETTLASGETLTIYVTARANEISTASREITNRVVLNSEQIENLEANTITHTLIGSSYNPDDNNNQGGNGENPGETTYRLSGIAWLDANRNGQRDADESILSGIKVYLLDSETNNVISNAETNESGEYLFQNLSEGRYVVAFEYDNTKYDVTTYQAEGINTTVNSDAINMELTINGNEKNYAATNTIVLSSNTYNVDLGLVESIKFDLELTKGVSLIQVSNSRGTENYTFDNTDLAKVEIPGKQMNGSVVAITYTFKVKNTGAVAGYAKKIVDYIPSDLSFSSTLNPEWYQDTDGNLYNTSLENRIINPGEEVELSLVLTKTMTDENTGLVNNTAEIYEASNDQGIQDTDSTPGNKGAEEDDFGTADVIITVKTGGVVVYTGIVLGVLAIFAIGAYIIKKKVLTRI